MNILMLEIPTIEREGSIPFGVLYAASSAVRAGHRVRLVDLIKDPIGYPELKRIIEEFKPGLIGMGGITASYKSCKDYTFQIKRDFPEIRIVAGGVLVSVADLLLERVGIDYVVHGEGESSFSSLITALETGDDLGTVKGISFRKNGVVVRTPAEPQISDLDKIGMPLFTLLDMPKYLESAETWAWDYFNEAPDEYAAVMKRIGKDKKFFPIITARGCTHRCVFCYRHQKGLRQHSVRYVVDMMRHLHDTYDVSVFQFNDELTTGSRVWVMEFCETLLREKLDLTFVILSSRVDTVDEEMLVMLKRAGCLMINYGYETGSVQIIKEIHKGVTIPQQVKTGLLTQKVGLKNIPEIIIGFPSESDSTVQETIAFLKKLNTWPISVNTPIPFPETGLWDIAVRKGLISDKEEFILGYRRGLFVNFTAYPDRRVHQWVRKVQVEIKMHWLASRMKYKEWFGTWLFYQVSLFCGAVLPQSAIVRLQQLRRRWQQKSTSAVVPGAAVHERT